MNIYDKIFFINFILFVIIYLININTSGRYTSGVIGQWVEIDKWHSWIPPIYVLLTFLSIPVYLIYKIIVS